MSFYSADFIKEMPKSDLHLHLDGSLRLDSLIDMAARSKLVLPSNSVAGLKELVFKDNYQNLGEYLHCFQYTCGVLRDMENLEQAAYELAVDNQLEGVNYIEVRFAPQLLMDLPAGIDFDRVMHTVNNGLKRAQHRIEAIIDRRVHRLSSIIKRRARSSTNIGPVAARKVSSTSWWLCAVRAACIPSAETRI